MLSTLAAIRLNEHIDTNGQTRTPGILFYYMHMDIVTLIYFFLSDFKEQEHIKQDEKELKERIEQEHNERKERERNERTKQERYEQEHKKLTEHIEQERKELTARMEQEQKELMLPIKI
ncbi:hypothetical protein Tco_0066911 [Tanacetum coccineum]